jgi:hypothetical protein
MSSNNHFAMLSDTNVDENEALILNNELNNNGTNYCWLNAPLYAFVAFEDVLNLYKTFNCPDVSRINKEQENIYNHIFNLMDKSRNVNTIWNDDLYKSIHKELCKISECDNVLLPTVGDGNFSNPQPVIDIFKNVLVSNCPDTRSPLVVETYNPKVSDIFQNKLLEDKDGKKLIALVVGRNPTTKINLMSETNEINVGHFVAYIRNKDDKNKWKKYDSGKTDDQYNYELKTIFPTYENKDKYWNFFGIYYNGVNYTNSIENPTKMSNLVDFKKQIKLKSNIPHVIIDNFIPIQKPKGKILDIGNIGEDETYKDINKKDIYYTYNLAIDENLFYKIILKYPSSKYSEQFELFLNKIFSNFFSSKKYNEKIRDKEQFYPEMFTFLFGDYLKFIYDDVELMKEINSVDVDLNEQLVKSHSEKISIYVNNYFNYGLRLDNTIEISRRKFLNNLMCSVIRPKDIKDNYNPKQTSDKKTNYDNLNKLVKNSQYDFIKVKNEVFIIPEKRKSTYDMVKITDDFKNKKISDDEYEYLYNYDISEKINISNDFTYVINWIFKTFNKYFLNVSDVKTNEELQPNDYELLNKYWEAQKSYDFYTENSETKLKEFIEIEKSSKKKYRNIFYNKWKTLLNYFSNFNRYYYDDYYFNELGNKSQSLSHCLENFISSKSIPNDDNDEPSNFRYLFVYCLMSPQQHNVLKDIYNDANKKQRTIELSKLKYNFFKYLKYIQKLNQLIQDCILNSNQNLKIINYSKYYFTKIIKFYEMDKLDFKQEYEKETDIEFFKNYIIYFIESDIVNYLYSQLEKDLVVKTFYNGIKEFINVQYNKIYIEKSINLYEINYTISLKDLLVCVLKEIEKNENVDNFINKLINKINSITNILDKSQQKIKLSSIEFTMKTSSKSKLKLKCIGCPDFSFNESDNDYYKKIINDSIEQIINEEKKNSEESELHPYSKVLMDNNKYEEQKDNNKYEEQKENRLWVIINDSLINLKIKGSYNPTVITCVKSIIQTSKKYNFFDIFKIVKEKEQEQEQIDIFNIVKEKEQIDKEKEQEQEQIDKVNDIINDTLLEMTNHLQCTYDENPQNFVCDSEVMSYKFQKNIFDDMDKQKINKKIKCFDGSIDRIVELSYKFFIPYDKSLGKCVYNLINKNKYVRYECSFLEIIKKNVLGNKQIYIRNREEFSENFINFVNGDLKELMEKYYSDAFEPNYEELIEDLSNLVIKKFKELTGIKLKGTNITVSVDLENKLYLKIKQFLETCDEMSQISKYYEPVQIEYGIKSFISYYSDNEDKIPIITKDTNFCKDMFELFKIELKITSKEDKVYNISINPEYYDFKLNSYVSMGVIIGNFIYIYKNKLSSKFDENTIEEYIQNAIDYLYSIYLSEKDKLGEIQDIQDIYNYIYKDVNKYIYISKHVNNLYNSEKFKTDIIPEYYVENLNIIKNKMIDLIFRSNEQNISFGNKIVKTDIFSTDTDKDINLKLMNIFGYVKAMNNIPKLSEQIETKPKQETKQETKPKIKIQPKQESKPRTKPATSYADAVEPSLEDKLKSTIEINETNIRIYVNPEIKEPLYSTIKLYLKTCEEISKLSVYYYPIQIESGINLLINYYNDQIIKVDEKTFCDDFTINLVCLMTREIIKSYNEINLIKIHPEFFKIWLNKYINMGIIIINYILNSTLFVSNIYTQKALDYLSNFYLTKDFTGIITKDGFYCILYDDIYRYSYIIDCLNKFYDDKKQFYNKNIKPNYTPQDLKRIEKHIIDLLMTNNEINIQYYTKGRQDNIEIDMNEKLYNKKTQYPCISNNDFTKLINHFATKYKIEKQKIKEVKPPNSVQEKIIYDSKKKVFIIPDTYNYKIIAKNQGEPTNLKECLDKFLRENFNMFMGYSDEDLVSIFNLMGKKLQDTSKLPDRNGKEIFQKIKKKWCFNTEFKYLFTLARDELGISSR